MLNRKLLEVLKYLPAVEKKRLRQFLISPYFNNGSQSNEITRLYDHIVRYDAREEHPALSKQAVFDKFFPDRQFEENVKSPLDALTSKLFHLVRRFLAQSDMEQEYGELYEHLSLARFYRKFAFEERFWQTIQSVRRIQEESPLRDAIHFFNQYRVEEEEQLFRGLYNSFEDDVNLNAVHRNLDLFYSILKLEYTCALAYQKRTAQIEEKNKPLLIENIKELSIEGGPLDVPINRIYRLLMNLLETSEVGESLEQLESQLDHLKDQISIDRFKDLKAYIRFLWFQRYLNSGDDSSLQNTFNIYRKHLDKGYFYYDGLIPFTTHRNLVIFALKLGHFIWVNDFLDSHPPERIGGTRYPSEIHSLNLAEYYFYLKEFEEAQKKLVYRHFKNPTFSILADLLLVKIYFETQNELMDSRMKALDQKVRRSNLSRETKIRYYNFLKKLDKIIKYGGQTQNPKRARLIEEIKTMPDIVAREWLLEKLA